MDLAVRRLLRAFEKAITVICVGAEARFSRLKKVKVRNWGPRFEGKESHGAVFGGGGGSAEDSCV